MSINDAGQIIGWADNRQSYHRATLFDPADAGNNIDLGILLGGSRSYAYSINNNGQIVGVVYPSQGYGRATLFDPTGGQNNIDLNTIIDPASGWTLRSANSINDYGWIVGYGINSAGQEHAYLLIPEPATIVLLGFGVFGLRKRYKK